MRSHFSISAGPPANITRRAQIRQPASLIGQGVVCFGLTQARTLTPRPEFFPPMPARRFTHVAVFCLLFAGVCLLSGCTDATTSASPAISEDRAAAAPRSSALPSDDELRAKLDRAIELTRRRQMSPQVNNAWQIVHGILAYGYDLQINDNGKLAPALEWLLQGGELRGWAFAPAEKGLKDIEEPGSKSGEGHDDQWLGYLAQCGVLPDTSLVARGQTFRVQDLITQAQWDVREGMEATWTLMAFSAYLPSDAQWTARDGSQWSIERLLELECRQDLNTSSCGGTHRLYGIASAVNRRLDEGGELSGVWKTADEKIHEAIESAREFQQPDGGFSINYFQRSSTSPELGLRLNTTGHVLEFLTLALTDEELRQPWMTRAAVYLCDLLEHTDQQPIECGGLYHAAHGLILYRLRRFRGDD